MTLKSYSLVWLAFLFSACSVSNPLGQTDQESENLSNEISNPEEVNTPNSPSPPVAKGCITTTASGMQQFTCEGLTVHASIPPACQEAGCGLILQIHGDTGTGPLMNANTDLFNLGNQHGYIVIAPTGPAFGFGYPGSTWTTNEDAKLIAITRLFAEVFRADDKKIHVTGFSRGGFMTWRLLCDAADLFASAAPAAAGNGNGETTCFSAGRAPSRQIDILFLMGQTDVPVPIATMNSIRDAAIANYSAGPKVTITQNGEYTHNRWSTTSGVDIETFEHTYETDPAGPFGSSKGHCFPGSKMDPMAPQYAVPCKGPNAFTWGEEVIKFFKNHPKRG